MRQKRAPDHLKDAAFRRVLFQFWRVTNSMTQLPDALSPDALSPDALSPDALSPDALSPDALSPDALSPDALSPDALSPDALSPDALSPDALSPDALSPDALSPDALSPDALSPDALSPDALSRAQALGLFIACGVARAAPSRSASRLERWLEHGHHAGMAWMGKPESVEKRADVRRLLPGARSVVALAMLYRTDAPWDAASLGEIARYARGDDYHDWMKARLRELLEWAKAAGGGAGLACVDTAPVLEREWAQRAGLGWIGKNSLLMNRAFGSYVLLGELILEVELPPDEPHAADFCGTCTRCIDACPTNALLEPRVLDSNLCIAYHTIENRELAPLQLREDFGDQVFGCDICQQVCPWNQKAERDGVFSAEPERWTRPQLPTLHEWVALPQTEFSARLQGSPLKRAKRRGMRRNAARALKNRARKRR